MRFSTRFTLLSLAFSLCLMASLALVVPPARGQEAGKTGWSPTSTTVLESDGKVVLTFTKAEPGRIVYRTMDGGCSVHPPWVPESPEDPQFRDCGTPRAKAPGDYGAVSGEMIFTSAGSRTITIPIVDDDLDESDEPFMVKATEGENGGEQTWLYSARVLIIDDDDPNYTPTGSSSSSDQSNPQPAGPASPPATTSSSPDAMDAGNQSGVVNPGDPTLEVERSAGDEAEPIAADTIREDNFILMAGLRALALVMIAAAGFALKKKFERKKTP